VSQNADILSPIAVDAVLAIIDPLTATNVDLNDIKIVKQAWTFSWTLTILISWSSTRRTEETNQNIFFPHQ
jgi:hypothetical protein